MTVRVVPLKAVSGLRFDLILEDFATVTLSVPPEDVRGTDRLADIIRKRVLDYLQEFGYDANNLHIVFC